MPQILSPAEARILGVLVEKSRITPDAYPLTVNSLTAGCNQKTSREPVMNLTDAEVQACLEELRHRTLIMESYGASGRVLRYAHNFAKVYDLPSAAVGLLAVLILRGSQTVSELRANCERIQHFADASAVEGYLDELAERTDGPLVMKMAKQPGSREHRWTHLLCGEVIESATPAEAVTNLGGLEARVSQLETEVAELRELVNNLLS
jgi:uncharacterized protein YceH (UPF0502 family)